MKLHHRKKLWLRLQLMMGFALLGLLVSACSLPGSSSTSAGVTPTASSHPVGSKPPATGKLPTGSQLPANQIKPLTFNLIYNDTAFDRDVAQIYTPGSPTFHKFLTPDQITQQYAVSDAQQQQVIDWLTKNGFTIDATDKLHTSIKVHGTVATIERALHITLKSYTIDGRTFFMQEGTPRIADPAGAFVSSVTGLDNFAFPQFKPPFGLLAHGQTSALSGNCANYGAKQNLTRDKLAAAYQINQLYQQGFKGQGMTIGVAEFGDGYDPHDLANYATCAGIGTPNVQNINVNGHPSSGAGQGEAIMDLELIAGL
ncbi:MAG TPA: protease pro-enzyme activation domain-containing protein, partial [Ktedonobacteraceae bacterium]|nr:protease pro-enzyme activation domain-containing protein [Ktedonobacteraceae bacterium]